MKKLLAYARRYPMIAFYEAVNTFGYYMCRCSLYVEDVAIDIQGWASDELDIHQTMLWRETGGKGGEE